MSKIYQGLVDWYKTPLGMTATRWILRCLGSRFADNSGELILYSSPFVLPERSDGNNKNQFVRFTRQEDLMPQDLLCELSEMPIQEKSIDKLILIHHLEFLDNIDLLLDEAERIISEDGEIIIIGFNQFSLWGVIRFLYRKIALPAVKSYQSISKVKKKLTERSFKTQKIQTLFFRPPIGSQIWLNRLKLIETLGRFGRFMPGAYYLIHAKKQTYPMLPLWKRWRLLRSDFSEEVAIDTSANRGASSPTKLNKEI